MESWTDITDEQFFKQVAVEPELCQVACKFGLEPPNTYPPMRGGNAGLQVKARRWILENRSVCIHFESRRRGEFRIDVELFPYESGVDLDEARQIDLQVPLRTKKLLITEIRNAEGGFKSIGANTKYLRDASSPSTCTALKFDKHLGEKCSPSACALFYSTVVNESTDIVDILVEGLISRGDINK